jgi:subtilisin-like proprotein convertase family protein
VRIDIGAFEVAPGTIRGQKWNDLDGNGVKDFGEPGLAGWTIFLDENGNGQYDINSQTYASTDVPRFTPPFSNVFSSLFVDGAGPIEDVNVTLDISHPVAANTEAHLISPTGISIRLFASVPDGGSNFTNTTFDDEAATSIFSGSPPFTGNFRPEFPLSSFDGQNPNGVWTLRFGNLDRDTSATLNSWSLRFSSSERATTTDANGNYEFTDLPPGNYAVGEVPQPGWEPTSPDAFDALLNYLGASSAAIAALVPNRFDFFEGDFGYFINDGGNDMYDGGNVLNTNLAGQIPYTGGVIVPGDFAFGPGSEYFTAKFPGLFVMAANNISISSFEITGNVGADGSGAASTEALETTVDGLTYTILVKRVYDAFDPSVNHIIIVPGAGRGLGHLASSNTDDDFHAVTNLSTRSEIYYALVAREFGQYLESADVLAVAGAILAGVGSAPIHYVTVQSGEIVTADFGNHAPPSSIRGQAWHDFDGDRELDPGEPGLANRTIYIDRNENGVLDLNQGNLEPDEYPGGTPLGNVHAAATLSVAGVPGASVVSTSSFNASTGSLVFGSNLSAGWFAGHRLLVEFSEPTEFVRIDAISDGEADVGALEAYDQHGALLATYVTGALGFNQVETMSITRPTADIAFVVIAGTAGESIHLDNLHWGVNERWTTTDGTGNYELTGLSPGLHPVAQVLPPGWSQTSPSPIALLLERLNANHAAIGAHVPNRFDFLEGATGSEIVDGGQDMYDGGNFLTTNRASMIEYTNGAIMHSDAFGPDSEYFTAKYPGMFVLAATDISINAFEIGGNLGADGAGFVDGVLLQTVVEGSEFTIVVKRVWGAGTPSVNHIVIVPGDGTNVRLHMDATSDSDLQIVTGLSSVEEMYYLLVSSYDGGYMFDGAIINLANEFLENVGKSAQRVAVGSGEDVTGIDFGSEGPPPAPAMAGDYNRDGVVGSADYTVWRNSLWQTGLLRFSGADGDGDGSITPADFAVWKTHFGEVLSAGTAIEMTNFAARDAVGTAVSTPLSTANAVGVVEAEPEVDAAAVRSAPSAAVWFDAVRPTVSSPFKIRGAVDEGEAVSERGGDALLNLLTPLAFEALESDDIGGPSAKAQEDRSARAFANAKDEAFSTLSAALHGRTTRRLVRH